jgi:hypothetical protein
MRSTCSSFVYCWNARQLSKQRYPKLGLYRSEFEHPIGHAIQNIIVVHPSLFRCEIDQPQMRRCQVENSVCIGIALWVFYLVLFIGVQLWEIQILRKSAEAEIDFTRRRIQHQLRKQGNSNISRSSSEAKQLPREFEELLLEAREKVSHPLSILDSGMVLAAWRFLHDAERLAVNIIETPYVAARLRRAQAELRELPEEQQRIWEATLKEHTLRAEQQNTLRADLSEFLANLQAELRELPEEQQRIWEATLREHALYTLRAEQQNTLQAEQQNTLRAYLSEFLANLYEARDNEFARFLKLQRLLSFLVLNGLGLTLALILAGYGPILLAGAVGGLLSRLARVYRGSPETPDYGLALAQVLPALLWGSLSAWAGLHLIAILQSQEIVSIKQLGELIPPIKSGSTQIPLLAIGFLFGFSERLLDSIAEKTNQLWEKQEKTQSEKQQQPSG